MDLLQAVILSAVEGLTEFLPISSTGHLILTAKLLAIPETNFVKTFEIFIQGGAILAVVVLYARSLLSDFDLLKKVIVAFIPTGILGLALYKIIKDVLLGNLLITVFSLVAGGAIIIAAERYFSKNTPRETTDKLTLKQAAGIGLIQSVSMIPGVSRSAATILGGMFLGLSRESAVKFSFMLAVPTMFAATGYDFYKSFKVINTSEIQTLLIGFVVAFIVALFAVKWFIRFIQRSNLTSFGVYRIILGILFWVIIMQV